MVLAGGEGKRLMPLTADRAKPAVPFAGSYRLIDFALSNLINSGLRRIVVLTQYKSHSLDRHVSQTWRMSPLLGAYVASVPAQQRLGKRWYTGSADAILQSMNALSDEKPDYVVVVGADHVYRMDFDQMLQSHIDSGMEATVAAIRQPISIAPQFEAFKAALAPAFAGRAEDTTEENLQARIRGTLLMALSNKTGALVLTTGNKSEMATGYCTLYGDMAGGFAVIKDIAKTLVYKLCHYRNQIQPVIPERILTRAPSAELRPNQTDQDSLPPYEVLDAILMRYMEQNQSSAEIIAAGFQSAAVFKVTHLIQLNEYKRRQAPPGVRITARAFGRDWRYPITSGAKL